MLPSSRELVKKMEGRPFTLLGINTDESAGKLKSVMEKEQITWPNIYDGPRGPICKSWNVQAFPTLYILDEAGVIRHRDLHGPQFEKIVSEMVEKAEKAKKKPG